MDRDREDRVKMMGQRNPRVPKQHPTPHNHMAQIDQVPWADGGDQTDHSLFLCKSMSIAISQILHTKHSAIDTISNWHVGWLKLADH